MTVLLDTTFIIDVVRGDIAAVDLMRELEVGSDEVVIPTVVVFELWEGVELSRAPLRETDLVEEALGSHTILPLSLDHAKRAGQLSGGLSRRGIVLGDADLLIAAVALEHDAEVVTRNARDFDRIADLRVRTY